MGHQVNHQQGALQLQAESRRVQPNSHLQCFPAEVDHAMQVQLREAEAGGKGKGAKGKSKGKGKGTGKGGGSAGNQNGIARDQEIVAMFQALNKKPSSKERGSPSDKKKKGSGGGGDAAPGMKLADELKGRSKYHRQIAADVQTFGDTLRALAKEITEFSATTREEVTALHDKALVTLEKLVDEREVLKQVEEWPNLKWEMIIVAVVRHHILQDFFTQIESWPPRPMPPYQELEAIEKAMEIIRSKVEDLNRTKSEDTAQFNRAGVYFDWRLQKQVQQNAVKFGHRYCTIALAAYAHAQQAVGPGEHIPAKVRTCLNNAANFSFLKVYQFAGGFDRHTKELFTRINTILNELQAQSKKS